MELGGLIGYGASIPALIRRTATYIDKIFKGASPSDLSVEQPTLPGEDGAAFLAWRARQGAITLARCR